MRIETALTRLLGIDLPIVQAGMSWASSNAASFSVDAAKVLLRSSSAAPDDSSRSMSSVNSLRKVRIMPMSRPTVRVSPMPAAITARL